MGYYGRYPVNRCYEPETYFYDGCCSLHDGYSISSYVAPYVIVAKLEPDVNSGVNTSVNNFPLVT